MTTIDETPANAWAEHPDYPLSDWKYQVASGDTRRGYREWVESMIEMEASDAVTWDEPATPPSAGDWTTWPDFDEGGDNGATIIGTADAPGKLDGKLLFVSLRDATPADIAVAKAAPKLLAALRAVRARIRGEWDDPDLLAFGPLAIKDEDVLAIAERAIAAAEAA